MNSNQLKPLANVFVSCSLRKEDEPFVDFVCNLLRNYQLYPFGTVGKFDASPENPVALMQRNIQLANFIVIIATKRYVTKDVHSEKQSNSISEMIHTEVGMASISGKPIVVFVEKGANVGNFLPMVTQYITLEKSEESVLEQEPLIYSLLNNAYLMFKENQRKESNKELGKLILNGLALWGGLKLLSGSSNEEYYNEDNEC